ADLLQHPDAWRSLGFLAKVSPGGNVLTLHIELFGHEATVTAPVSEGSKPIWVTGLDLAVAAIEDAILGGPGDVPEIVEEWSFEFGSRLRGLRAVGLRGRWGWAL